MAAYSHPVIGGPSSPLYYVPPQPAPVYGPPPTAVIPPPQPVVRVRDNGGNRAGSGAGPGTGMEFGVPWLDASGGILHTLATLLGTATAPTGVSGGIANPDTGGGATPLGNDWFGKSWQQLLAGIPNPATPPANNGNNGMGGGTGGDHWGNIGDIDWSRWGQHQNRPQNSGSGGSNPFSGWGGGDGGSGGGRSYSGSSPMKNVPWGK